MSGCLIHAVRRTSNVTRFLLRPSLRSPAAISRLASSSSKDEEDGGPVRYTTSPAFRLTPKSGGGPPRGDPSKLRYRPPWWQFPVVASTLAVFMVYFFTLREENDVDYVIENGDEEEPAAAYERHLLVRALGILDQGDDAGARARVRARLAELDREKRARLEARGFAIPKAQ